MGTTKEPQTKKAIKRAMVIGMDGNIHISDFTGESRRMQWKHCCGECLADLTTKNCSCSDIIHFCDSDCDDDNEEKLPQHIMGGSKNCSNHDTTDSSGKRSSPSLCHAGDDIMMYRQKIRHSSAKKKNPSRSTSSDLSGKISGENAALSHAEEEMIRHSPKQNIPSTLKHKHDRDCDIEKAMSTRTTAEVGIAEKTKREYKEDTKESLQILRMYLIMPLILLLLLALTTFIIMAPLILYMKGD